MDLQPQDRLFLEKRHSIAQAIHQKYLQDQQGKKPPDDAAMNPWERLSESLKESNRQQADHIIEKLRRIACDIRLPGSNPPVPFAFKPEEVEILAEMEHDRWVAERLLEGWRIGPRDPERKISPYLVAWNKLEDDIKDYDRQAVRGIPDILARVGLEVYRPNPQ
jgi:RyR domain